MVAAVDAAGAALGALGMLAFAIVFWSMVKSSIPAAFVSASLAWLTVSVVAWYARRNMRKMRISEKRAASPLAAKVDRTGVRPRSKPSR
jgi:hypothetical protein